MYCRKVSLTSISCRNSFHLLGRLAGRYHTYLDVLQEGFSVVISGHPVPFSFSAVVTPSGQQPNNSSRQREGGQPFNLGPLAGDTPSGQHLNSVSLQVITSGQPESGKRKKYRTRD